MIAPAKPRNRLLGANGKPMPSPRPEKSDHIQRRPIHARYDAAQSGGEMVNYWASADALSADSANSQGVRAKLVQRSRYEVANNGFTAGIVTTHANYIVGTGPNLRLQTKSKEFNRMVELTWLRWSKAVLLRRKLWTLCHAKVTDGEGFAIVSNNPRNRHEVKLDLKLIETEQCHTPYLPIWTPNYIDGIQFDEFGNPESYDILPYHPGGPWGPGMTTLVPDRIPAEFVLHWFHQRRPGQHRGTPELTSTLNVGANCRRWREATIRAAEVAARITGALETNFPPNEDDAQLSPMAEFEIPAGMFVAMPVGNKLSQMRAEHPNAAYEVFLRSQIAEQARPLCQPINVAQGDSSNYSYASGKLDTLTYNLAADVAREDANDTVMEPLFRLWYREAELVFGWTAQGTQAEPPHVWDWPPYPIADAEAQARADDSRLKNGTETLSGVYSKSGRDFEDIVVDMAADYGITEDEMRERLLTAIFTAGQPAQPTGAAA